MNGFFSFRIYFHSHFLKLQRPRKTNESYKTPIIVFRFVACLLLLHREVLLKRTCWKVLWKNYVIRLFVCRGNKNIQVILATGVWVMECYRIFTLRGWTVRRVMSPHGLTKTFFDASLWSWPYKPRKLHTHFRRLHITGQILTDNVYLWMKEKVIYFMSTYISMSNLLKTKLGTGHANNSERKLLR